MKISKSKIFTSKQFLFLLYLVYFCIFQVLYKTWIVPVFAYEGYDDNFNLLYFIVACGAIGSLVFYSKNNSLPSSFFLHFIIATIFVPSAVLFSGSGRGVNAIAITYIAVVCIIITLKFARTKTLKTREISMMGMAYVLLIISVVSLISIVFFSGFAFLNFDFSKVYEIRIEAQEDLPGIFGYVNSAVVKIAIPFGIVLAVTSRKWLMTIVFFILSILFFGFTQNKSPVFNPILVLFVYWISKSPRMKSYFIISAILILILSAIDFWWMNSNGSPGSGWFSSLFSRRTLLVPSLLNFDYIDFFINNNKYYWSMSKISFGLFKPPYDIAAPFLIGYEYFGRADMSANVGWIGSGFSNAGYFGVMLYSICLGVLFSFFDSYAIKIGSRIVIALFLTPIFTIISSTDLMTGLISHGLLYGLLIMIFMQPYKIHQNTSWRE